MCGEGGRWGGGEWSQHLFTATYFSMSAWSLGWQEACSSALQMTEWELPDKCNLSCSSLQDSRTCSSFPQRVLPATSANFYVMESLRLIILACLCKCKWIIVFVTCLNYVLPPFLFYFLYFISILILFIVYDTVHLCKQHPSIPSKLLFLSQMYPSDKILKHDRYSMYLQNKWLIFILNMTLAKFFSEL